MVTPALSGDRILPVTGAYLACCGQPVATPVAGETPAENHIALPSLLRGDMPSARRRRTHTLSFSSMKKGKPKGVACARQQSRHGASLKRRWWSRRRDQRESGVDSRRASNAWRGRRHQQRHGAKTTILTCRLSGTQRAVRQP
ncbi:hypothetical protein KCP78_09000 [Salmonella enterica subsp. enterica]|nr:hypothetical protein KCP78_09000 [Salmonella enterica subsp. enterica]